MHHGIIGLVLQEGGGPPAGPSRGGLSASWEGHMGLPNTSWDYWLGPSEGGTLAGPSRGGPSASWEGHMGPPNAS